MRASGVKKKTAAPVAALVLAAGLGTRLNRGPKGFLHFGGGTLLAHILRTLRPCVEHIRIAVPQGYLAAGRRIAGPAADVMIGGSSRQETVRRLLEKSREPILVIFDAARPFASARLVRRVIDAARRYGSGIACFPSPIPALRQRRGYITGSIPAADYVLPQSPQAYRRELLLAAYGAVGCKTAMQTTHELVLQSGIQLKAVRGEERNIKITSELDWEIAQKVIAPAMRKFNHHKET